jgi:hypothetical protein
LLNQDLVLTATVRDTSDLTFKLCQSTHLKAKHVTSDITREGVATLLKVWGLPATQSEDEPVH